MNRYSLKYTDNMPHEWTGGYAKAWFVRIRPKYRDDAGILAHELQHVRQWWRLLFLHPILYLLCKRYRLWAEVRAYKVQLQHQPALDDQDTYRRMYAISIAQRYDLDVSSEGAYQLLR